jgi:predicted TIM-barrel fold metal-dependent hydrolase
MAETTSRTILDADSHIMELADFLDPFIDDAQRDRLKRHRMGALEPVLDRAIEKAEERRADPAKAAAAEERLWVDKGWSAMGAFDPRERSRVLDLMGFQGQLVFATFASALFAGRDEDRLYAGSSAQNRALADFCSSDDRMLAVAYVPLADPTRAVTLATEAIEAGCAAVMVPSTAAGERAPTHPDLDGFWDLLAESDTPFVLHVGGGGPLLDRAFHNNDMPVSDHLGGGENVRSKDFLAIDSSPSLFLGVLVLDGLFDRFPKLRGGCIEQGAGWVVSWLHKLEFGLRSFRRTEPPLTRLQMTPTDYVKKHLKFTPYPGEPVGWMIEQAGRELFMFSSDYPHPEGTKNPIERFEATLAGISDADKDLFYAGNMAELLGSKVPALVHGPS